MMLPAIPSEWVDAIGAFGAFVIVVLVLRMQERFIDRVITLAEKLADQIERMAGTKEEEA